MSRIVRFASSLVGLLLALPFGASATHFNNVFIFGDSLSDSGNLALAIPNREGLPTGNTFIPDFPYAISNRLTNAQVWVEMAAPTFGFSGVPSLAGGPNYAFAGARTSGGAVPSLLTQFFGLHLPTHPISPNALYIVAGGGNNARDAFEDIFACGTNLACIGSVIGTTATQFGQDINQIVEALEAGGAMHILVWNTPDIGKVPAVRALGAQAMAIASALASAMNAQLLVDLADDPHVDIFDLFGLVNLVVSPANPFSFANVTDACGAIPGCNPSTFFFWDGIHPTSGGHALLAQLVLQAVPEPETLALLALALAGLGLQRRKAKAAPFPP